jgi:opacity protein-like surface antigen
MKQVIKSLVLSAAVAVVLAPMQARADGFVTPWIGTAFASNIDNGRGTFGVSAGGMGAGIIGGEVDFGWNPSFFGTQNEFGNNSVLNLMGNVIVGVPIGGTHGGGVRPYLVGGLGLIRSQIDGNGTVFTPLSSTNMFGWDLGGGVMGYFNQHIGLRGDYRYMRATQDINGAATDPTNAFHGDQLHFSRLTVGVVFR